MVFGKKKEKAPEPVLREEKAIKEEIEVESNPVLLNYHEEMLIGMKLVLEELKEHTRLLEKAVEE